MCSTTSRGELQPRLCQPAACRALFSHAACLLPDLQLAELEAVTAVEGEKVETDARLRQALDRCELGPAGICPFFIGESRCMCCCRGAEGDWVSLQVPSAAANSMLAGATP